MAKGTGRKKGRTVSRQVHSPPQRTFRDTARIVQTFAILAYILASCAPLYLVLLMVRAVAGRTTTLNFAFAASVTLVGVAAVAALLVGKKKMSGQSAELVRLRERCRMLEEELGRGKRPSLPAPKTENVP